MDWRSQFKQTNMNHVYAMLDLTGPFVEETVVIDVSAEVTDLSERNLFDDSSDEESEDTERVERTESRKRNLFEDSSDEENEEERLEREVERDFFDSSGRNLLDAPSGKKRSKKRCAWRELQREMYGTSFSSDEDSDEDI